MNKFLKNFLILFIAVFLMSAISARAENVQIIFSYDDKGIDKYVATDYNLYVDAVKGCTVAVNQTSTHPDGLQFVCVLEPLSAGFHQFTLTAKKTDGFETLHSDPYPYMITQEEAGRPVIINVIINATEPPQVTVQ